MESGKQVDTLFWYLIVSRNSCSINVEAATRGCDFARSIGNELSGKLVNLSVRPPWTIPECLILPPPLHQV